MAFRYYTNTSNYLLTGDKASILLAYQTEENVLIILSTKEV